MEDQVHEWKTLVDEILSNEVSWNYFLLFSKRRKCSAKDCKSPPSAMWNYFHICFDIGSICRTFDSNFFGHCWKSCRSWERNEWWQWKLCTLVVKCLHSHLDIVIYLSIIPVSLASDLVCGRSIVWVLFFKHACKINNYSENDSSAVQHQCLYWLHNVYIAKIFMITMFQYCSIFFSVSPGFQLPFERFPRSTVCFLRLSLAVVFLTRPVATGSFSTTRTRH
jgi:hypothetical protein